METLGTVFGSFSKGCEGSIALNFSESGKTGFCSKTCALYNHCYASDAEGYHPSIAKNGGRHRRNVEGFLRAVLSDRAKLASAPWVRFSAFGALPAKPTETESGLFRELAQSLNPSVVHMPTETVAKARLYRSLGYRPRVSVQNKGWRAAKWALAAGFSVSLVVDPPDFGKGWKGRAIEAGRAYARQLRERGLPAKTCPAIAGRAKCGECRLCSGSLAVVIYPRH